MDDLPYEYDWRLPEINENDDDIIDWSKVEYNSYYNSEEYIASKFPPGFQQSFFFKPFIKKLAEQRKYKPILPLEEWESRNKENLIDSNNIDNA